MIIMKIWWQKSASKKGQLITIDMVIGVLIFASIVFLTASIRNIIISELQKDTAKNMLMREGISATDILIMTTGNPYNWTAETENITQLGIAKYKSHVLDNAKINELTILAANKYNRTKEILGISREYLLIIEDLDKNKLYQIGNSSLNSTNTISISRFAVLNGNITKVKLIVYDWT